MTRVFLVDDEYLAIEGLKRLIDWEKFDMEICGAAFDGQRALTQILEAKPDLVITDIRMPGMNGLALIAALKPKLPDALFVVISGYNDFAYIREALRLGLTDYLDKPITIEKIGETLQNVRRILAARSARCGQIVTPLRSAMRALLESGDQSSLSEQEIERMTGIQLFGIRQIVLIEFVCSAEKGPSADQLEHIAQARLNAFSVRATAYRAEKAAFLLLHGLREDATAPHFRAALDQTIRLLMEECALEWAGIGGRYPSMADLPKAACEAHRAVAYARFFEDDIVYLDDIEHRPGLPTSMIGDRSQIGFDLRTGAWESAIEKLKEELAKLKCSGLSPELYCHVCLELLYLGLSVCAETGQPFSRNGEPFLPHLEIAAMNGSDAIDRWVVATFEEMYAWLRRQRAGVARKDVLVAKAYIDRHYGEPITLNALAELCDMHPTYFSALFKGQVGMTYVHYLNEVRMEQAKRLLRDGQKVKSVSEQVGFLNPRYFADKFKALTGFTPDQFRRIK